MTDSRVSIQSAGQHTRGYSAGQRTGTRVAATAASRGSVISEYLVRRRAAAGTS